MSEPNGKYYPILDNLLPQWWHIYFQVEKGVYRNIASRRGTYYEIIAFAERLNKHRGFHGYFLRRGEREC